MLILGKAVNAFPQTDTRFWRVAPESSENQNDLPNGDRLVGRELNIENSWLNDSGTYTLRVSRGSCVADELRVNATGNNFKFFFPTASTPNEYGLNDEFCSVTILHRDL